MTDAQPSPPAWYRDGIDHIWLPYTQMKTARPPLPVVRSEGARLHLADGRVLIDGIASWWTAAHGYNHPHILAAVEAQLRRLPHVMFGGLVHEPALRLARRLAEIAPGDLERVFFAESGSVSVEVALKMAVQYWLNRGETRARFVFFRHGYHGDTTGAMAVCDPDEGMHARFSALLPRHLMAELPEDDARTRALDALLARRRHEIAGIVIEPLVQGAGGMRFHAPAVLATVARLAQEHGVLLIADEIFTGFGRTGTLFASEQAAVVPDIMTLSKALTGGVAPLSACLARAHVFAAFCDDDPEKALMHGPTYMAHALGCAAANAALDLFAREDRLAQVAAIAEQMRTELAPCRDLPAVREVRVKGAIGVVELREPPDLEALRAAFVARGVWIRPLGQVIYLTPPLTIAPDDLSRLTGAIRAVLAD